MQCHDLLLVAEEACVNVIRHAYSPNAQGEMTLRVTTETQGARHVRLTIEDAGKPFNPLSQTPPDPLAPVEDREIGGLGIMLIRQLSDRLAYRRDPQLGNIFEIEKTLLDGPAASGQAQTD